MNPISEYNPFQYKAMNKYESDLVLTEDHFKNDQSGEELVSICDRVLSSDLIPDRQQVSVCDQIESAIAKHIKVLRNQTDEQLKKKLVKKICELRIKLNQLNDINEQMYVCGHKLSKCEENSKNVMQLLCDLCLKKAKPKIFGLKKNDNYLLICQYCQFVIHRFCQNNVMMIDYRSVDISMI